MSTHYLATCRSNQDRYLSPTRVSQTAVQISQQSTGKRLNARVSRVVPTRAPQLDPVSTTSISIPVGYHVRNLARYLSSNQYCGLGSLQVLAVETRVRDNEKGVRWACGLVLDASAARRAVDLTQESPRVSDCLNRRGAYLHENQTKASSRSSHCRCAVTATISQAVSW